MNEEMIHMLASHAQEMAKTALKKADSGYDLIKDVKVSLKQLYVFLKSSYKREIINNKKIK